MTNPEVLDELERRFPPRASLPGNGEPGSGLANSPRRSYMDTAIVLSPADYETLRSLIADARHNAELSAAREEVAKLTRERDELLADLSGECKDCHASLTSLSNQDGCAWCEVLKLREEVERMRASLPLNDNRTRNEAEKLLGAQVAQCSGRITDGGPELIAWYYPAKETREVVVSLLAENAALRLQIETRTVPQPIEIDTTINERELR